MTNADDISLFLLKFYDKQEKIPQLLMRSGYFSDYLKKMGYVSVMNIPQIVLKL